MKKGETLIKVKNLYKLFGKNKKKALKLLDEGYTKKEILDKTGVTIGVQDANLDIKEGEIFVIMGLSGSGKSTLLRCINRLIEPTKGEVYVDNTDIISMDKKELREFRKEKFGMVFQHFGLFPYRSVMGNVEFGLEIQNVDKERRKELSKNAIQQVGLSGWENKMPASLSGGMKQRVGLARALAVEADYLLMDEPFSALDPLIKRDMQDNLIELQEKIQKTIIFITHDLDEALKVGDRIAIMKDGKIVQTGNHEQILTEAKNDYVKEFVHDVNRSRVYDARDIMTKPDDILYIHEDGPKTALHKMKNYNIDYMFVCDKNKKYLGYVVIEDVKEAIDQKKSVLDDIIKKSRTAKTNENLNNLFSKITNNSYPLPVVDHDNKFKGLITKTNIITNLSRDND
ncbi:MAG: glycine betaine/L-proline ABC transporter ATP-binding protein [Candidatus Mcinerneyibacterium aminivorans]|uniref:Glycine betaine/L-proline ABC transporter ATP-binding protein n=1 Tax=Candidatus Mcinerneyibacterium aminivorans TaxID=2703815 RepID=A0A5D0MJK6_9BACT|nr:MAG: glycine betaine/L-proline ABC transporter ATP-binding protein [Candidatus Mcinerneyibacterium aminivorans]